MLLVFLTNRSTRQLDQCVAQICKVLGQLVSYAAGCVLQQ
jgi:ribonucleotide monophosphatase NagD (HAD superfamily)